MPLQTNAHTRPAQAVRKADKSRRRARNPLRHTNISTVAFSVPCWLIPTTFCDEKSERALFCGNSCSHSRNGPHRLFLHAAESSVHVRVMWLKPVPERPPQHARSPFAAIRLSSRNADHRKNWPNSRDRTKTARNPGSCCKRRRRPFPPVALPGRNSECAAPPEYASTGVASQFCVVENFLAS